MLKVLSSSSLGVFPVTAGMFTAIRPGARKSNGASDSQVDGEDGPDADKPPGTY
jgi:hypothetical protein